MLLFSKENIESSNNFLEECEGEKEPMDRSLKHLFIWKIHPNVSKLLANINITIIKNIFRNNAIINALFKLPNFWQIN